MILICREWHCNMPNNKSVKSSIKSVRDILIRRTWRHCNTVHTIEKAKLNTHSVEEQNERNCHCESKAVTYQFYDSIESLAHTSSAVFLNGCCGHTRQVVQSKSKAAAVKPDANFFLYWKVKGGGRHQRYISLQF